MKEEWKSFKEGKWTTTIDVENFIDINYKEYKEGIPSFL